MVRHLLLTILLVMTFGLASGCANLARDVLVNAKKHECRNLGHAERENCIRRAEAARKEAERQAEELRSPAARGDRTPPEPKERF